MASIYVMEPTYCYKDVKGNNCDDIHSVAMSMLSYPKEYGMLLTNPNDNLFLYLESHTKCNIKRLRSYFEKTETFDPRVAVMKVVYEIDPRDSSDRSLPIVYIEGNREDFRQRGA